MARLFQPLAKYKYTEIQIRAGKFSSEHSAPNLKARHFGCGQGYICPITLLLHLSDYTAAPFVRLHCCPICPITLRVMLLGGSQSPHCNIPALLILLTVMGYLLLTPFHAKLKIAEFEFGFCEILKKLLAPKLKPRNRQFGMLGILRRLPRQI